MADLHAAGAVARDRAEHRCSIPHAIRTRRWAAYAAIRAHTKRPCSLASSVLVSASMRPNSVSMLTVSDRLNVTGFAVSPHQHLSSPPATPSPASHLLPSWAGISQVNSSRWASRLPQVLDTPSQKSIPGVRSRAGIPAQERFSVTSAGFAPACCREHLPCCCSAGISALSPSSALA